MESRSDEGSAKCDVELGKEELTIKTHIEKIEEGLGTQSHLEASSHAENFQTLKLQMEINPSCGNGSCLVFIYLFLLVICVVITSMLVPQ